MSQQNSTATTNRLQLSKILLCVKYCSRVLSTWEIVCFVFPTIVKQFRKTVQNSAPGFTTAPYKTAPSNC